MQFNNLKLQTSNLANHHLDMIKQLKELQFRILDQELNKWKREQQLSGNGAPFANNLDQIQKWYGHGKKQNAPCCSLVIPVQIIWLELDNYLDSHITKAEKLQISIS